MNLINVIHPAFYRISPIIGGWDWHELDKASTRERDANLRLFLAEMSGRADTALYWYQTPKGHATGKELNEGKILWGDDDFSGLFSDKVARLESQDTGRLYEKDITFFLDQDIDTVTFIGGLFYLCLKQAAQQFSWEVVGKRDIPLHYVPELCVGYASSPNIQEVSVPFSPVSLREALNS